MTYNKRTWLNPDDSPSTGNIVCFAGKSKDWNGQDFENIFVSISDCHNSARLHKCPDDTMDDFLFKLRTLRDEINNFIGYLVSQQF